ncbi:MAG TPA: flagellar biosynthesis anti-sigma factor FlgM [Terriglobales bacterium]|nr:flagellar biosynthesis anti-sigma factor FlgM [Terriglobales bacterium]
MKVDLNASNLSGIISSQGSQSANPAVSDSSPSEPLGEDKATLSGDSTNAQNLTTKALEIPEVRQDKVEALRAAIKNGDYKIEPSKIAEAMIQESE